DHRPHDHRETPGVTLIHASAMSAGRPRTTENVEVPSSDPAPRGARDAAECTPERAPAAERRMCDALPQGRAVPARASRTRPGRGHGGDPVVTATIGMITLLVGLVAWGLALIVVAP